MSYRRKRRSERYWRSGETRYVSKGEGIRRLRPLRPEAEKFGEMQLGGQFRSRRRGFDRLLGHRRIARSKRGTGSGNRPRDCPADI